MEMFNEVALKERLGPLKKQRNLWNLEGLDRHLLMHIKKYGVENPFQSEEIQSQIKTTNLEKYGTEYYLQSEDKKEKNKETCLNKYGVEHYSKTNELIVISLYHLPSFNRDKLSIGECALCAVS